MRGEPKAIRVDWPVVFRWVSVIAAIAIAWALTVDTRPSAVQGLAVVVYAALSVLAAIRPRARSDVGLALAAAVMLIVTIEFGGAAYLVCIVFGVMAATVNRWPPLLGRVVRGVTVPTMGIASLSMGFPLLIPMLPLLLWASATSGRILRHLFAFFAALAVAMAVVLTAWLIGAEDQPPDGVYLALIAVAYPVIAFAPRIHRRSR